MTELHDKYPVYNFAQHKGYPTGAHKSAIFAHGPCPVHRRTFQPLKSWYPLPEPEETKDGDALANSVEEGKGKGSAKGKAGAKGKGDGKDKVEGPVVPAAASHVAAVSGGEPKV